jgi:hypothetical protein
VVLVRIDVSEERIASVIKVTRIVELITLAVTSNSSTLCDFFSVLWLLITSNVPSSPIPVTQMMERIRSSETLVLKRATRRHIPEYGIVYCYI